jgi:hypothetical protein
MGSNPLYKITFEYEVQLGFNEFLKYNLDSQKSRETTAYHENTTL